MDLYRLYMHPYGNESLWDYAGDPPVSIRSSLLWNYIILYMDSTWRLSLLCSIVVHDIHGTEVHSMLNSIPDSDG